MERDDIKTAVEGTQVVQTAEEMGTTQQSNEQVVQTEKELGNNSEVKGTEQQSLFDAPKTEEINNQVETSKSFFDSEKTEEPKEVNWQKEYEDFKSAVEKEKSEYEAQKIAEEAKEAKIKTRLEKILGGDIDITNVNITDLMKAGAGEDYSYMSTEQLIEHSVKTNPNFQNLSDDEKSESLEAAKAKLDGMTPLEKSDYRSEILSKLNKSGEESELFKTLKEIQDEQKSAIKDPDKYFEERLAKQREEIIADASDKITQVVSSFVGQKINGFEVTQEHVTKMMDKQNSDITQFSPKDRGETLFKAVTYESYGNYMYEKGKKEALIASSNPSANMGAPLISEKPEEKGIGTATKDDFRKAN